MDAQEIFDTVARHLLTQKARAEDNLGCMYHAPDGKKCAVGCLITDEEYSPSMENTAISDLINNNRLKRLSPFQGLLQDLQYVHDRILPEEWPFRLRDFASAHHLSPAVLKEFEE